MMSEKMFVKDVVVLVNSIVLYWPGVMMSWYGEERRGEEILTGAELVWLLPADHCHGSVRPGQPHSQDRD